jgi:hypothetical protein
MKKSGSVSQLHVDKCIKFARLKIGAVGVVVKILNSKVRLPDDVLFIGEEASLKTQSAREIKNIGGGRDVEEPTEEVVAETDEEAKELEDAVASIETEEATETDDDVEVESDEKEDSAEEPKEEPKEEPNEESKEVDEKEATKTEATK